MRPSPALFVALAVTVSPAAGSAAATPRGVAIKIACQGPDVAAGRKVALENKLTIGSTPGACFGRMQIYDGPNQEYVATAPSKACPKGTAMEVYGRSNAGSWYSFFEKPVCGSTISIGPKDPWGDWMLTIDGKHYDSRGAFYLPVTY